MDVPQQNPKLIDNINITLKDDLEETITKKSKLQIAAACFSLYAYEELKNSLANIDELKFIFTSPTFTMDKTEKSKREFYIPRRDRERNLYGTEFEIRLRNKMTQKSIARECADWIRKKARFKSNVTNQIVPGIVNVLSENEKYAYYPFDEFTTVGLGCERGNYAYRYINRLDYPISKAYIDNFEHLWNDRQNYEDVTDSVIESIATAYNENSPEYIYFITLYNIFNEFLNDLSEDDLPNEATGFKQSEIWNKLYDFQKDAALAIINKLEKYNGCILADSVGLGKTFTALSVIKYYENRNKSVLVLCPKKLADNWNTYRDNYVNNPIAKDRLNYKVLFHTDLSRTEGMSNGTDLSRLNWDNYDLVVIDESHNFRNGIGTHSGTQENRYKRLMKDVINSGVKTKVLMLSATPVNNRFYDLKNQLAIAYGGDPENLNPHLKTEKGVNGIFRHAQIAFKEWSKMEPQTRTTEALLKLLDFDFFELLDSVTIARSRKHIERYYNTSEIGKFPTRRKPISYRPSLTDLEKAITYDEIYKLLMLLSLNVYSPSDFLYESKREKYSSQGLSISGRERGIRRLMSIGLLKRLESSVHSFLMTLERIKAQNETRIEEINQHEKGGNKSLNVYKITEDDLDMDEENTDYFSDANKVEIDLDDIDYKSWRDELVKDIETLEILIMMVKDITPEYDLKLQKLFSVLAEKIEHPINGNNKKVLIFTAYADTAEYLYTQVSSYISRNFALNTAVITGSIDGRSTIKGLKATLNNVLTCFSPISKERDVLMPNSTDNIDILIATDCISEGQNLQDCDYLINYDIHWNPVRIIQRFGRIDRIGSKNAEIQMVNFWPNITLDAYINLKSRVESRMKVTVLTSTGDDDFINDDENGDLLYRKQQLERLQKEVVDIEDIGTGVSIMDLGLNEFRLDLLDYLKTHDNLETAPHGLHAVVPATQELPPGVIFVMRNINNTVNEGDRNRIHPFYMVYVREDEEIFCTYLNPKQLLDNIRLLCRGKNTPIREVYGPFNRETNDGENMEAMSELLSRAIESIIETKEESDFDSLFTPGGTSALINTITGLNEFELICFIVVKQPQNGETPC